MGGSAKVAEESNVHDQQSQGESGVATLTMPARGKVAELPRWSVLLHNDDQSDMDYVTDTIRELTTLDRQEAELRMKEAHRTGVALLITTHREHAELLEEQFRSKRLVVTIEPE